MAVTVLAFQWFPEQLNVSSLDYDPYVGVLISDSEMEDFEVAIVAAGFEVDDFNIVPLEDVEVPLEDDESTGIEQHPITGTVAVHRISTDEFITYAAGSGSIWPQVFEADLQAGNFGEP